MASFAVLVMHVGRWDSDNCYIDYTIEGVISKESSSYKELYNVVAMQLGVDMNVIKLKIEYKVEESNTPMLIHNDMGVRVYIMLKKAANDFNKYPICISILDNSNNITELCESSNKEKGMVRSVCIDGIAEFETRQMTIGELIESLCVLGSGSYDGVISDPCNKYMEVAQAYKDKATLKSVMERYAIEKRFHYRTVRSNAIKPVIVVDGSHLRGPYNGTFVAASTMDGAGHIFPLAYGIIDSENDTAWTWFFVQLREAYGEMNNTCVISDRNEIIIKAVTRVYNNVPHYACMWHLWGNVEKKFRKSSKELCPVFYTMTKT
ncbi:hypothetical protein KY285_030482 [Solanum tuberosum]|nr:hypothetical protein KY285_030482 [Solanum tuberosum]